MIIELLLLVLLLLDYSSQTGSIVFSPAAPCSGLFHSEEIKLLVNKAADKYP